MTDKTEKFLKIISIALPTAAILILAVVIGLFLSSAFRIYDTVKDTEPEDTRSKVMFQGVEIPVSDEVLVDHTASAREYLDGLLREDSVGQGELIDDIRHNHEEGKDPISLKDLTAYDYGEFTVYLDSLASNTTPKTHSTVAYLHQAFPIEMLTPIDESSAFIVYRLLDGAREVNVYLPCYHAQAVENPELSEWYIYCYCYYVTERLSYADAESVRIGDSVHTLTKRFSALSYQVRDSNLIKPLVVMLEEGILYLFLPDSVIDEKIQHGVDLSHWMKDARIEDMVFIPYGHIFTEEEKTALIEKNPKYKSFMEYSSIPYMLLPE